MVNFILGIATALAVEFILVIYISFGGYKND